MFIGTEKLTHTYMPGTPFATTALRDVSFSIKQGAFTLIIGSSGSGKTTLAQHLNGLLKPSAGQVFFAGKPISFDRMALLNLRRRVGLVFQMAEEHFFSENIFDEVAFGVRNLGLPDRDIEIRVKRALKRVGLDADEISERHPFQVSAGQKRLTAIAAVLSMEPEVLILDEPTAGLDPATRSNLFELLSQLNINGGITVIVSTHHLDEAAAVADQVIVLHRGRLCMDGSRDEIFGKRNELQQLGLALPRPTEIMHLLREGGISVSTNIFTLNEAREEINKIKRRRVQ